MAIPDFQSIMLPLLKYAGDFQEHSFRDAISVLAEMYGLTQDERRQPLPSGGQPLFNNRVGWATTHLRKAGLLESTRRGFFIITDQGQAVLASPPARIDLRYLRQFDKYIEFKSRKNGDSMPEDSSEPVAHTPEEILQSAHRTLTRELSEEILELLMKCSPSFFERLVVELLVAMGYGGSMNEAGQALGKSGDGGIDGIIKEDRLGLDIIYIQAKRWDGVVGRPEIQKFAGALQGKRSRKGVFLTTSSFSREAMEFVSHIDSKIILIDGERLTELMIEHNIGVTPVEKYEVKRIDSDYFVDGL